MVQYKTHNPIAFLKELEQLQEQQSKRTEAEGLKAFAETVQSNTDLFDREYYIQVLKEKGINIEG